MQMRDWVLHYSKSQLNALPRIAIYAIMLSIERLPHSACDLLQSSIQPVLYMQAALLTKYWHCLSSEYKHHLHVQIPLVATPVSRGVACQLWKNTAPYIGDYGGKHSQLTVCCTVYRCPCHPRQLLSSV